MSAGRDTSGLYSFRDARIPVRCKVTLQRSAPGAVPIAGQAINISRSGLRAVWKHGSAADFEKSQKVWLLVTLPFGFGDYAVKAETMWVQSKEGTIECGFRYTEQKPDDEKRLGTFIDTRPVRALFLGCDEVAEPLAAAMSAHPIFPSFLPTTEGAFEALQNDELACVIVGNGISPVDALSFLKQAYARLPGLAAPSVVFRAGNDFSPFANLVGSGQIFFITQKPPQVSEMAAIVVGCVERYWTNVRREEVEHGAAYNSEDAVFRTVLQHAQHANRQQSARDLCGAAEEAIKELTAASRAYCLFHDPEGETLWAPTTNQRQERAVSTAAGIVSFSARTGTQSMVVNATADGRYEADADDPENPGPDHHSSISLMVEPIVTFERRVAAVLVAVRDTSQGPFLREHQATLHVYGQQLTATFGRLVSQIQLERLRAGQPAQHNQMFNEEALQEYLQGQGEVGKILRLSSPWLTYAYRGLVAFMLLMLAFVCLAKVNYFGQGHAIVRMENRTTVTSRTQGVVTKVLAEAGQRVAANTTIAVLDDSRERAELARIDKDLDQQLIRWLRDPSDTAAGKLISELRGQREVALNNARLRTLSTPNAGLITDVRVLVGQAVAVGDTVASLSHDEEPTYSLIALFPGRFRPQAHIGGQIRLEFQGYPFAYVGVPISALGEEVVGPKEARRIVGADLGDSIPIEGPVFIARAQLPSDGFELDGTRYGYFDGLTASAEVRLRAEPIIVMLMPGLRRFYQSWSSEEEPR